MKLTGKEQVDGKTVLVTSTRRFILKPKIRKFIEGRKLCAGYWDWLELPDKKIIPDCLSFQLDAWNR